MKRARIYRRVHPGCRNPWHITVFEDTGIWVKRTVLAPAPTWDAAMESAFEAVGLDVPIEHWEQP